MQSQLIRIKTSSGTPLYIDICADEDQKIFVLMNITAFTVGTFFESAEKALKECIDVINRVLNYKKDGDKIEALYSLPGGVFLTNDEMAAILLSNSPGR
ncbi:MAG: hypothetical protein Q7S46_03490 [Gallionella sp.]|nr:hypothetical protein [Gallionella sp.]